MNISPKTVSSSLHLGLLVPRIGIPFRFEVLVYLALGSLVGCSDPVSRAVDTGADVESDLDADIGETDALDSSTSDSRADSDGKLDTDLNETGMPDSSTLDSSTDAEPQVDDPLFEALCELIQRCQDELGPAFVDEDDCQQHLSRLYHCQRDPGAINLDSMERCLSWLDMVQCDNDTLNFGCIALARPLFCADPLEQWALRGAPGCGTIFEAPASALDESCESLPCDEDLYCLRGPTSSICSVCQTLAEEGESCLDNQFAPSYKPCAAWLTCSSDRVCTPKLLLESTCQQDGQCASGFCRSGSCAAPLRLGDSADIYASDQCAGFLVWRDGVCAPRQLSGESCHYDVDCLLNSVCVEGQCREREVCALRQPGEPCVTEPMGCAEDSFCNNTADPQLCEQIHPLDASCEFTEDCGDDAYCSLTEQICTSYAGTGHSCAGALLCAHSHYCDDAVGSICTPKLSDGIECDYGYECLSDHCSSDTAQCAPAPPCTMP